MRSSTGRMLEITHNQVSKTFHSKLSDADLTKLLHPQLPLDPRRFQLRHGVLVAFVFMYTNTRT